MRRFRFLFIALILFGAAYLLNRATANWHYILRVEAGKVAYLATFDTSAEDWSLSQGRLKTQILESGVLRVEVGEVDSLPFAQASPHFGDVDVSVATTVMDGPENNGFGLIFRLQTGDNTAPGDDSFYLFEISSDGYYRVLRSLNGIQRELSTWIPSAVINTGLGVANSLRVVAKGNEFQFFVNDQSIELCIPDDPDGISTFPATGECIGGQMLDTLVDNTIQSGQLGVAAQSFDEAGVVVDFDNLVVYGPT